MPAWLEPTASAAQAQAVQQLAHAALNCAAPPPREASALLGLGAATSTSCLQAPTEAVLRLLASQGVHQPRLSQQQPEHSFGQPEPGHGQASLDAAAVSDGDDETGAALLEALLDLPQEAGGSMGHSLLRSSLLVQALWPLAGRLV